MFERCLTIIDEEIQKYEKMILLNPKDKAKYEFPRYRLKPLMYFWEKKYKDAILPILTYKPFHKEYLFSLR